jgi:hypothetical protein
MLVYFTDVVSKNKVAVNPKYAVAVFPVAEGELKGKTIISLVNGSVAVEESQIDVVGVLQGQIE